MTCPRRGGPPGSRRADGEAVVLTAAESDGLTVDGRPFGGEVRLAPDPGPASAARVAYGERRQVVLVREGAWGVRDFDPEILRAPGVRRSASLRDDGSLWAVFAYAASGNGSYRYRFPYPAAPDAEGLTTVDFNRALLPPCAFADHLVCPFPPPGNTLIEVAAGERMLAWGAPGVNVRRG
ncbi:DUF1684 domain-containing protein [Streptomyces tibetensis]